MLQLTRQPNLALVNSNQEHDATGIENIAPFRILSDEQLAAIFQRAIYHEVIASDAFQRLKDIQFLGAIDYVVRTGGSRSIHRHTRFQHSLRVAQLALQFAHLSKFNESEEKLLVIAALLHDIGHAPLSHSLEPTFKQRFELTHHSASEKIIQGIVPIGHHLGNALRAHKICPEKVLALINSKSVERSVEAFRCPVNIDTIEAICRSYTYLSKICVNAQPARIVLALVRKNEEDIKVLDDFWQLKDVVYNCLITSKMGIMADYICRKYMEENTNVWMGIYYHSETALRKKHPKLFDSLRELRISGNHRSLKEGVKISYQRRRFVIDKSVRIKTYEDMFGRYKQTRSSAVLEL